MIFFPCPPAQVVLEVLANWGRMIWYMLSPFFLPVSLPLLQGQEAGRRKLMFVLIWFLVGRVCVFFIVRNSCSPMWANPRTYVGVKVSSLLVQCLCFSAFLLKHWLFLSRDQSSNARSCVGPLCGSLEGSLRMGGPAEVWHSLLSTISSLWYNLKPLPIQTSSPPGST